MHVTIVGGGFAGVKTALEIAENKDNVVTLISDRDEFQYYPALYSSATGRSHLESWTPLGEIFGNHDNVRVYIDTMTSIDAKRRIVVGAMGTEYAYDDLVIAIGVVTTYFGIEGLETYSYGIKSEDEIRRLKHRLFIDLAENHQVDKNYVIVGAGPTGVELSAALGTYIARLAKYYNVKKHHVNIRLIEAAPRVLPRGSEAGSRAVENRLKSLGIDVRTGSKVERLEADEIIVDGKPISSHTVIWTSGVTNNPFFSEFPDIFKLNEHGKVVVDDHLMAHDRIYVIGDNAATEYAGLAQTAIHNAQFIAKHLERKAARKRLVPYKPSKPTTAVPVGSRWAIVERGPIRIYGVLGAIIRRLADVIGYSEMLPFGTSLGAWRAAYVYEHDYFSPSPSKRIKKRS